MLNFTFKFIFLFLVTIFFSSSLIVSVASANTGKPNSTVPSSAENNADDESDIGDVGSNAALEVAKAEAQAESKKKNQPKLSSFLFQLDSAFNISLGVERNNNDTYLIIEMDHNPSRNEFVFRYDTVAPGRITSLVVLKSQAFGFNNKPVAVLPMIEIESPNNSSAKFIVDSKNQRTHQRVNLSKVLRDLYAKSLLLSLDGKSHNPEYIEEINILTLRPISEEKLATEFYEIKIPFRTFKEDQVIQIFGSEPLAELSEPAEFKIGEQIKLKPNFKIPHRSKSTQWIIKPTQNSGDYLVYELIENPKLGDQYTIPSIAENVDRVLPKTKNGQLWVKVAQTSSSITYKLRNPNTKLNPSILYRYIKTFITSVDKEIQSGSAPASAVIKSLPLIPIKILDNRVAEVANSILSINPTNPLEQILEVLINEQDHTLNSEIETEASSCTVYLK